MSGPRGCGFASLNARTAFMWCQLDRDHKGPCDFGRTLAPLTFAPFTKGAASMTTYWIVSFHDRHGVVLSHRAEERDDLLELGGVIEATLETDTPSVAYLAFEAWIGAFIQRGASS